ncbi:MAG: hypothetical protein EP332_03945 [Bacteroidetes bacterium]|nr:MAG: hypothetical protein EP332_03945 [Bacteroidota bacterium]
MNTLKKLLYWDLLLLHRNKLIVLGLVVAGIYLLLFKLLAGLGDLHSLLLVLVFNDPVVTGLLFAGVLMLFESSQNTLVAVQVSPLPVEKYLLSKVISLSLLSTVSALLMNLAAIGIDFNFVHFILGVAGTSALFVMAGLYLGFGAKGFNQFLMRSLGFLMLSALPFLAYFQLIPDVYLVWLPMYAGMKMIDAAYHSLDWYYLVYAYGYLGFSLYIAWKRLIHHFKEVR